MTTERQTRLTVDETALLREIARWRRDHDVSYWRSTGNLGHFTQWSEFGVDGRQVSLDFGRDDEGWYATLTIGRKRELGGVRLNDDRSLIQAIDALVAFGYLPPRFSSAYRQGWHAAQVWESPATHSTDPDEFARLFHDPENVSFPAGDPVW